LRSPEHGRALRGGSFVRTRLALKTLGLAAFLLLVTAGSVTLLASGCGADDSAGKATMTTEETEAPMSALPLLDQKAPEDFQTATFAFG